MCVCEATCVCMRLCTCVHACEGMCAHTCACVSEHMRVHVCMRPRTCVHYVWASACMCVCVCACAHVWVGRLMLTFTRCLCEFEVSPRSHLQKGWCDLWRLAVTWGHRQSRKPGIMSSRVPVLSGRSFSQGAPTLSPFVGLLPPEARHLGVGTPGWS